MSRALLNLSRLLHLPHYRKRWMLMIQAFVDDSGTHDQAKIVLMAGFLSSYQRWRKLESDWNRVLNPPDEVGRPAKPRIFHATDCLGKDGHGDFEGWSKDRRNTLVDRLAVIARQRTIWGFGAAFSRQDYQEVVPEWIKYKWEHPYYLCFFHIAQVLALSRQHFSFPKDEKIAFVIAHKRKYVGLMSELYDQVRTNEKVGGVLGKMTPYGEPAEDIPLQAADLIGYLIRTFYEKDYFKPGSAHPRTTELLRVLTWKEHHNTPYRFLEPHFLDRATLEGFVRAYTETHQELGTDWEWNSKKQG
jgi:hypothetical protein